MSADQRAVRAPDRAHRADLTSNTRQSVDTGPVRILPGLWSLPVQIPIAALRVVNVYAFEHPDGSLTLLDAGWDSEESLRSLSRALARIGRRLDDIATVVVTHAHPDHLGLAHRVRAISGAPVLMHEHEAARLAATPALPVRFRQAIRDRFPRWGVPSDILDELLSATAPSSESSWTVPVDPVADGARLDVPGWSLEVVWTPGHTAGHLCLYESEHHLLFTGDHVLPRITPGVGSHPAEHSDALGDFLHSLQRVARLDVREVLPGHEQRFANLSGRVAELLRHHERRLTEVAEIVLRSPGCTAWSVTQELSWSRPLDLFGGAMIRGAIAETVAHLVHLERSGCLRAQIVPAGSPPVQRWFPC